MRRALPLSALAALLALSACDSGKAGPPTSARIVQVVIDDVPLTDPNGDSWDGGGGPEVYFRLFDDAIDYKTSPDDARLDARADGNVFAVNSPDDSYPDATTASFPMQWNVDPGHVVRNLSSPLYLAAFDEDGFGQGGDDPMAESEVFQPAEVAPDVADGQVRTLTVGGFNRDGGAEPYAPSDAATGVRFRVSVVFED